MGIRTLLWPDAQLSESVYVDSRCEVHRDCAPSWYMHEDTLELALESHQADVSRQLTVTMQLYLQQRALFTMKHS
jgi:hypothetical protein